MNADQLRAEALAVFDGPECPQEVRDAIEFCSGCIAAALAGRDAAPTVEARWVMVPKVPTRKMTQAAAEQRRDHLHSPQMSVDESAQRVWEAMLAAAPSRPDAQSLHAAIMNLRHVDPMSPPQGGSWPVAFLNGHELGWHDARHAAAQLAAAQVDAPVAKDKTP